MPMRVGGRNAQSVRLVIGPIGEPRAQKFFVKDNGYINPYRRERHERDVLSVAGGRCSGGGGGRVGGVHWVG